MARGNSSSGRYRDEEPRRRYANEGSRRRYVDEEEYEDEEYRRPRPRQRKRRKRRTWPALLLGCLGGILVAIIIIAVLVFLAISRATGSPIQLPGIGSSSNTGSGTSSGGGNSAPQLFHKTDVQPLSTVTSVGQIQVQNQVGDVTITTDPTIQTVKVTTVKTVKAASPSDAQAEYSKMNVQAQTTPATSTNSSTLTVTATVPGVIGNNTSDTIAITIALPPTMLSNGSAAPMLNITTTVGNVQVSGLNGVMMIKDTIGNVTVQQAQLFDGSHLQTNTGNVTFSGSIDTTTNPQANYKFQSEVGNLNVTLPAATNVTLDANTNVGSLHSDFPIAVQSSGNSANYYGPLAPGISPAVTLVLDVGSGNITLQKGQ